MLQVLKNDQIFTINLEDILYFSFAKNHEVVTKDGEYEQTFPKVALLNYLQEKIHCIEVDKDLFVNAKYVNSLNSFKQTLNIGDYELSISSKAIELLKMTQSFQDTHI